MKTPNQIATRALEIYVEKYNDKIGGKPLLVPIEAVQTLLVGAIEADRFQRSLKFDSLDRMLNAWENFDGDVTAFYGAWLDHINEGAELPEWAKA